MNNINTIFTALPSDDLIKLLTLPSANKPATYVSSEVITAAQKSDILKSGGGFTYILTIEDIDRLTQRLERGGTVIANLNEHYATLFEKAIEDKSFDNTLLYINSEPKSEKQTMPNFKDYFGDYESADKEELVTKIKALILAEALTDTTPRKSPKYALDFVLESELNPSAKIQEVGLPKKPLLDQTFPKDQSGKESIIMRILHAGIITELDEEEIRELPYSGLFDKDSRGVFEVDPVLALATLAAKIAGGRGLGFSELRDVFIDVITDSTYCRWSEKISITPHPLLGHFIHIALNDMSNAKENILNEIDRIDDKHLKAISEIPDTCNDPYGYMNEYFSNHVLNKLRDTLASVK